MKEKNEEQISLQEWKDIMKDKVLAQLEGWINDCTAPRSMCILMEHTTSDDMAAIMGLYSRNFMEVVIPHMLALKLSPQSNRDVAGIYMTCADGMESNPATFAEVERLANLPNTENRQATEGEIAEIPNMIAIENLPDEGEGH